MVRVKVLMKRGEVEAETVAVANSGYESDEPEIVVPTKVAQRLGMWPEFPQGTRTEIYKSPLGMDRLYFVPKAVNITLRAGDRDSGSVLVNVVIADKEDEVLLSDRLIDALNVELKKPGAGIWRFLDDPLDIERMSESPEYW